MEDMEDPEQFSGLYSSQVHLLESVYTNSSCISSVTFNRCLDIGINIL